MNPLISIIILNYNTKDITLRCLQSIVKFYKSHIEKNGIEIIIVDNNSIDDSVEKISVYSKQFKNIYVIENKENTGFSKGVNIGASYAKGEYLFFLNSDTQMRDGNLLDIVSFAQKNPDIAVIGTKLQNSDGTSQPSAGNFYSLFTVFLVLFMGKFFNIHISPKQTTQVDWVSGGSMLVKRSIFKKIGGFDENLFMYMEDMELCFRFKKTGYQIWFYEAINIVHDQQGSSNRSFAITQIYKGILYFYKLHKNILEYGIVKVLLLSKAILAILGGHLTGNAYLKSTYRKVLGF